MIRRVHTDAIMNRPLLVLPKATDKTELIKFNEVERQVYERVRDRWIRAINSYALVSCCGYD